MHPDHCNKTACQTSFSLFKYVDMPLGPRNAPRLLQILINSIFEEYLNYFWTLYLDYIFVYSSSTLDHPTIHWMGFSKLRSISLLAQNNQIKTTIYIFNLTELEFLRHTISSSSVKTDPNKTEVIKKLASATNIIEFQAFLSFCNYYGYFVHHFADLAGPLYTLLHKVATQHWINSEESAVYSLCTTIYSHPLLSLPGFLKPF